MSHGFADEQPQLLIEQALRLQPLLADHAEELAPLLDDRSLHRFTGGEPLSRDALERLYKVWESRRSPDGAELWFNWVIRKQDDGQAVGVAQATVGADQAEVAWVIAGRWQGRGYAKLVARRLVQWLSQERGLDVVAHIHPEHAASEAVARAAGLVPTSEVVGGERVWRASRPS